MQFSFVNKHDTKRHGYHVNPKKEYIGPIYEEHAVIKIRNLKYKNEMQF